MKRRFRPALPALAAFACSTSLLGCSPAPRVEEMIARGEDQTIGAPLRQLETGSLADSLGLSYVGGVADDPEGFLLTDILNDRVLRIDTSFRKVSEFGRTGEGPGELDAPIRIVRVGDAIVVGEMTNSRFSRFDADGRFMSSVPSDHAGGSFAVRADSRIIAAAPGDRHYGRLIEFRGAERTYLERPEDFVRSAADEPIGSFDSQILVGPRDTMHVFDDERGVLLKYDPDGRLLLARSLPADVLEAGRDGRRRLAADFARQGRRVVGAPFLKSMRFADDGSVLLLLVSKTDLVGLRVDPTDYTYRRLSGRLRQSGMTYVRAASDVAVRGDRLYAFSQYGLSMHPIRHRP
jgi:hypothetical protein